MGRRVMGESRDVGKADVLYRGGCVVGCDCEKTGIEWRWGREVVGCLYR